MYRTLSSLSFHERMLSHNNHFPVIVNSNSVHITLAGERNTTPECPDATVIWPQDTSQKYFQMAGPWEAQGAHFHACMPLSGCACSRILHHSPPLHTHHILVLLLDCVHTNRTLPVMREVPGLCALLQHCH